MIDRVKFKGVLRRLSVALFWLLFIALAGLFFTNDFGIVDLHKTSLITAVGIDVSGEEVQVTAQLAVPQPSSSGENIKYVEVQGSGETIADALNEINVKTGFYPQLQFCKLILLGESCMQKNIFRVLGCFYRKNYSELTSQVATCKGNAADLLALPTETGDMASSAIMNAISTELKKSANVSGATLKQIAVDNFSPSSACYMPYVEPNVVGTSEQGGNGDNAGGKPPSSQGGESGGGSGGGSGGEEGGQSGQSGGGEEGGEKVEFTARRTAVFSGGEFKGLLDEQQAFALNVLKNEIRLAVLPCDAGEYHYSLGLKGVKGKAKLSIKDGRPSLELSFGANAQIAGIKKPVEPRETAEDDDLTPEILQGAEREIERRFLSLMEFCVQSDCDFLGVKQLLYKFHHSDFDRLNKDILKEMEVNCKIKITSAN